MSGKSPAKYDETYKKLFTNSVLVEELMRYFVDEKLANELDFTTLESLETTSYSQDLEKRENDRILKIKRKSGGELYLLLMLEFQSSNDFSMAVRILNYVARLYEEITKTHGNNASLSLPASTHFRKGLKIVWVRRRPSEFHWLTASLSSVDCSRPSSAAKIACTNSLV